MFEFLSDSRANLACGLMESLVYILMFVSTSLNLNEKMFIATMKRSKGVTGTFTHFIYICFKELLCRIMNLSNVSNAVHTCILLTKHVCLWLTSQVTFLFNLISWALFIAFMKLSEGGI